MGRKQIRVDYGIKSRNGRCDASIGRQRVPNGSTMVTEGLFPKIGPGQWKMDTDHRSLSGTMTMGGCGVEDGGHGWLYMSVDPGGSHALKTGLRG